MKLWFWILLPLALVIGFAGIAIASSSPNADPGARGAPTLFGVGLFISAAGFTLALSLICLALWWLPVSKMKARRQRERSGSFVFVGQATTSLRELDRGAFSSTPIPTYIVCAVSDETVELWGARQLLIRLKSSSIHEVSVGTAVTSRAVPSLVFSTNLGVFEVVPGRKGWELFPVFDRGQVAHLGEEILRVMHSRGS